MPVKNFYKVTWCFPDGISLNQIDHTITEARNATGIKVEICRGVDVNYDHYLVKVWYRQRIAIHRAEKRKGAEYYNIEKFQNGRVVSCYQEQLRHWLNEGEKL